MFLREIEATSARAWDSEDGEARRSRARAETLWALGDAFPGLVVNRRRACCTNASKAYQLDLIHRSGFRVPQTLVTMVPNAARDFVHRLGGRVIYKSLSAERSIVKRLGREDLERLDMIRNCPVQLQELVPGIDLRVHVVGERVYATEIVSDASDYRYAHRGGETRVMRPVELPSDVMERCVHLTQELGLVVGGVDLRRTPEGDYCCFEVNPSPAYLWFEQVTGQRIGEGIAELLCRSRTWH